MLTYDLNLRGKKSIYEYLYECIRSDILCGNLKNGDKLPSKRELAKNHAIAVITVENAYAQLVIEGYVTSKEKSGFYVNAGITGKFGESSQLLSHATENVKDDFIK